MSKKETNPNAMFQPYRVASEITGLSYKYIRDGCLSGEIPCIRVGADMRVNMPLFIEQLNRESMHGAERTGGGRMRKPDKYRTILKNLVCD